MVFKRFRVDTGNPLSDPEQHSGTGGIIAERFTADYDPVEDRVRFDVCGSDNLSARIFLTRRIADRLVDAATAHLDAHPSNALLQRANGLRAGGQGVVSDWTGARLAPVHLLQESPFWLCRSVHVETGQSWIRMAFYGGNHSGVVLNLSNLAAKSFLDVMWLVYCKGRWSLDVFPKGMNPATERSMQRSKPQAN